MTGLNQSENMGKSMTEKLRKKHSKEVNFVDALAKGKIRPLTDGLRNRDPETRFRAAAALLLAVEKEINIDSAIAVILSRLKEKDIVVRRYLVEVLVRAADKGNQKTKDAITIEITKLMQSDRMLREAEKNSVNFTRISTACGDIMKILQEIERNEH